MKICFVLLALLACRILDAAETPTNLLSISLVVDKNFPRSMYDHIPKPEELKLVSPPVLADKDFVAFDMTNQTFTITPEAAKRLAAKLCELAGTQPYVFKSGEYELIPYPTPFVLQASGDSVYVGAFYTETSSSAFGGPVILAHDPFIATNLSTNVSFFIRLGYPWMREQPVGNAPDQRRDARIVSAVQNLFPHEK